MGKANRQRRRIKEKGRKREHPRATTPDAGQPRTPGAASRPRTEPNSFWSALREQPTTAELARNQVGMALHALVHGDRPGLELAIARLLDRAAEPGWRRAVDRVLGGCLQTEVTTAWRQGWQPADVVRFVRRELGTRQVPVIRDAISAELATYAGGTIDPRWTAQLAEIEAKVWWRPDQNHLEAWREQENAEWAEVVRAALAVLETLTLLPTLERLGPIPGAARPGGAAVRHPGPDVDERILSRVRALLAKAESTTFEAEAEALTSRAQALMARHSIDLALLAATGQNSTEEPTGRRLGIDNPYEGPKAMLLDAVARANRCRTVWSQRLGFSTAVGFPADLDGVEMLFTSLLVQATRAMMQAGSRTSAGGRSRTRAFRQSFLTAFAARIGERLTEATGEQTTAAAAEPGGRNLLPVLAARDHAVTDLVDAMFPELVQRSLGSVTDLEGWNSGRGAADVAVLHTGGAITT